MVEVDKIFSRVFIGRITIHHRPFRDRYLSIISDERPQKRAFLANNFQVENLAEDDFRRHNPRFQAEAATLAEIRAAIIRLEALLREEQEDEEAAEMMLLVA